jgi:hypothetical protein
MTMRTIRRAATLSLFAAALLGTAPSFAQDEPQSFNAFAAVAANGSIVRAARGPDPQRPRQLRGVGEDRPGEPSADRQRRLRLHRDRWRPSAVELRKQLDGATLDNATGILLWREFKLKGK